MKNLLPIAILIMTAGTPSLAQEGGTANAFDTAWLDYVEVSKAGDADAIVVAAKNALEIAEQTFPGNDERLPLLISNHGMALLKAKQWDAAREELERSVEAMKQIHGADSAKMIPVLANLADSRARIGKPFPQVRTYNQALKIAEKNYGEQSSEYADLALRAGVNITRLTRTGNGRKYLKEAYEINIARHGRDSREAGVAAFQLGKSEFASGDYKSATEYFLQALEGLHGDDPDVAEYEVVTRAFLVKSYEFRGMSDLATEHCVALGKSAMLSPDQDYVPIFRMAPKYPADKLTSRTEGYVDIEFTVDASGFVRDPVVIDTRGGRSFEKEAIDAVERFRYAPRFEDGQPVAVERVKTRISFKIEQ